MERPEDKKFTFTDERLKNLPVPPPGKRARYYDKQTVGLCARVTAGGIVLGCYRKFRNTGRPLDITLGRWPEEISIKKARERAGEINDDLRRGENPNAEKRAARAEMTIGQIWELVLAKHYRPKKNPATWRGYEHIFKKNFNRWKNVPLSEVTQAQVEAWHTKIQEDYRENIKAEYGGKCRDDCGHYAANNALRLLRTIYNKAALYGYQGANPTKGIPLFPVKSRERVPEGDEVKRLFEAILKHQNEAARDALLLLIFTGQRKSDVCAMKWDDINLDAAEWRFVIQKNREPHRVRLLPEASAILRERKGIDPEKVFPDSSLYLNLKRSWKAILQRAEIRNLRMHDLRRFHGSLLLRSGASLAIIQKALGHRSYQSTLVYARMNIDPVAAAQEGAFSPLLTKLGLRERKKRGKRKAA